MRSAILVLIALVALGAGYYTLQMSTKTPAAIAAIESIEVVTAGQNLEPGTVIDESMLSSMAIPRTQSLKEYFANKSSVVGMLARNPINAGDIMRRSNLIGPGDPSYISAVLPEGRRVVTIAVDAVTGLAGYLSPGDYVDVIFAHNLPFELTTVNPPGQVKPMVSEILVARAKVAAINTRPSPEAPATGQPPTNVSLEVDEADAQRLKLAEKYGTLSLAMRSLKEKHDAFTYPPSTAQELSRLALQPGSGPTGMVSIVRGTQMQPGGQLLAAPPMTPGGSVYVTRPQPEQQEAPAPEVSDAP